VKHVRTLLPEVAVVLAFIAITLLVAVIFGDEQPKPELSVPCKITEVYDGDTVTVEVTLTARVRLLDCWAPELEFGSQ